MKITKSGKFGKKSTVSSSDGEGTNVTPSLLMTETTSTLGRTLCDISNLVEARFRSNSCVLLKKKSLDSLSQEQVMPTTTFDSSCVTQGTQLQYNGGCVGEMETLSGKKYGSTIVQGSFGRFSKRIKITSTSTGIGLNSRNAPPSTNVTHGGRLVEDSSSTDVISVVSDPPLHAIHSSAPLKYMDIGDATYNCSFCGAYFWFEERLKWLSTARNPKYSLCCNHGKIRLPKVLPPPIQLQQLLFGQSERSKHYNQHIRSYNSMFSFTSMGGKIDKTVNQGGVPPVFKLHGQNYHRIGTLLPTPGQQPKFAQLYIYDTANEVSNRKASVRSDGFVNDLRDDIVEDLKVMLDDNNVLVQSFRMAKDMLLSSESKEITLRLVGKRSGDGRMYNLPSSSEVAALVVGDFESSIAERDIVIQSTKGKLKRINQLNPSYLSLQYPMLFPYGEDGYREDIPLTKSSSSSAGRKKVSMREYFAYRLHERDVDSKVILFSKRLFQQYLVGAYTMIESSRLNFIRLHQRQLRAEMYKGLQEVVLTGDCDAAKLGKRIILPSSFTGGARYMVQNYQDAMAICRWVGYPDLFLTLTCNPKWPEIVRYVQKDGCKPEDRPDILCRIFKAKLDAMINDIKKNKIFGEIKSVIFTIEFQKRGLPHAHILLFLGPQYKIRSPEDIDRIISAEIPNEHDDPEYFNAVKDLMIHGPCGKDSANSPCMVKGRCSKHYPKKFVESTAVDEDGYAVYRRRDNGRHVMKNGVLLDNRHVVPHNRYLLVTYGAHLNVEWCNQSRSIKYLFKYINKGDDRVTATFAETSSDGNVVEVVDEIKMYYDCRYISACEAAWRIFGFEIQFKDPTVERLSFHLPNEQSVVFSDVDRIESVLQRQTVSQSMFLGWMEANKKYIDARDLTYSQFPTKFVWKSDIREWVPRKRGFSIGRIFFVPPGCGESYYLRCLLNKVCGPKSYEEIRFVNGRQCENFREACYELGLLHDDKEYIDGIIEASEWSTGHSMRNLFATLLTSSCMSRPEHVWDKCWNLLCEDVLYQQRAILNHPGLQLSEPQIRGYGLAAIEKLLRNQGRSLLEFPMLPYPNAEFFEMRMNRLIHDETNYDRETLADELQQLVLNLNDEQHRVYTTILAACFEEIGKMFFVYGYGGSGKTYIWRTLSARLRSEGLIVLNVASSGIASLLLPGGRTAHSRFAIPFNLNEDSVCNISQGSPLAELIIKAHLIIWDEAPMMHKFCFEALDRSLRDIMRVVNQKRNDYVFGGKTIVFGGDFRQILPVIPKGSRQDIVHATINSSYLWNDCVILRLTKNMRLQGLDSSFESEKLIEFADWIANIGDGKVNEPNDGITPIEIPRIFLIEGYINPVSSMVDSIYPGFRNNSHGSSYYVERAILAPTLDVVNDVNEYMVGLNEADAKTYLSSDVACHIDENLESLTDLHTPEFINSICISGLPNHSLTLKVGTPVMLLRNIDSSIGLCNGTRLLITKLGHHVIEGEVISSGEVGQKVLIPRMSLTPSNSRIPFRFERRQFPIMISYAMTINKSQGQSLDYVGLILKKPVFCHGQLYVALSRVKNPLGLRIMICDDSSDESSHTTNNVVFKEVFHNI